MGLGDYLIVCMYNMLESVSSELARTECAGVQTVLLASSIYCAAEYDVDRQQQQQQQLQ